MIIMKNYDEIGGFTGVHRIGALLLLLEVAAIVRRQSHSPFDGKMCRGLLGFTVKGAR